MPLPIDTLLRVHASPVPAQIVFGACGSMATAPMDCAASLSNTGLKVVPPFEDFHTPPLAAPTYTVSRPSSFTAATAATRPLMAAEPMFRGPSKNHRRENHHHHGGKAADCLAHIGGFLSIKVATALGLKSIQGYSK